MDDTGPMSLIDVALTPAKIAPAEIAVVIDVLRASSTIVQALDAGYTGVLCCESVDTARRERAPGRVLAGEQACVRVPDFELGNSPAAIAATEPLGEELVLATTNGSPAIAAAAAVSGQVLVGSLLNLGATIAAIGAGSRLTLVCSGTDGEPALEDIYVAGRIVALLEGPLTDAARVAERVAHGYDGPEEPLRLSADGVILRSTGQADDIAHCAVESSIDLVAEVTCSGPGTAMVGVRSTVERSLPATPG